jgi:UDP-N-acetylmuramyl tripeptide synthase
MTHPAREPDMASGLPSPTIGDSRRLMGPNLMHPGVGAVLDVLLDDINPERCDALLCLWHERVASLADALGWTDAATVQRRYPGGASLFVHAPVDQLMTATEVTEAAWVFAEQVVNGHRTPDDARDDAALSGLLAFSEAEARPALVAVWSAAQQRGLNITFDEATVCIGSGVAARSWPIDELPAIDAMNWAVLRDIPIVLVTGSNGKTTVVRMVAAMARAEGHVVGYTCTDGVWIGDTQVEAGDWSGPVGARRVLQDRTVTLAVLESARGGMLRRGLALQRATVAAIVTLSPDHYGDYGITDLATLAEAKLVVARAVVDSGVLVYNASVPALVSALDSYPGRSRPVVFETVHSPHTELQTHGDQTNFEESNHPSIDSSPRVRASERGVLEGGVALTPEEFAQIPATLNGRAQHNILNAHIAASIANELGFGAPAKNALLHFGGAASDNVGRLTVLAVGNVTVVIDYAHNAQGVSALIDATRTMPAVRRAIALGTGGDRDDAALEAIAQAAFESGVIDLYIAKEMPKFLRGRAPGSISGVLLDALRRRGAPESQLASAPDDLAATRLALDWARDGDLVLLPTHDQRDAVLALIAERAKP